MEIQINFRVIEASLGYWQAQITEGPLIKIIKSEPYRLLSSDARFNEFMEAVKTACNEIYEKEVKRHLSIPESYRNTYPTPFVKSL